MRGPLPLLLIASSWIGAAGCSGDPGVAAGDATFPDAAFTTMSSDSGALGIAIRTAPEQPPSRGIDTVEYTITSKAGAPVDGLTLDVVPWMPDMGHGASITPTVTAVGEGRYVISEVEFFMPGKWVLRTTIDGASEDGATPTFEIP